jgi:hypothetical protein
VPTTPPIPSARVSRTGTSISAPPSAPEEARSWKWSSTIPPPSWGWSGARTSGRTSPSCGTFYPLEQFSTDEKIYFDEIDRDRRLAPYVSPVHAGQVMEERGYDTRVFTPPYVKPKHVVDPNKQFKRRAGEDIGGNLSPMERRNLAVRQNLEEEDRAIQAREEFQCSEGIRLGQVTVTGKGYGTVVLAFGRHTDLTVTLTSADRWGETGVNPVS